MKIPCWKITFLTLLLSTGNVTPPNDIYAHANANDYQNDQGNDNSIFENTMVRKLEAQSNIIDNYISTASTMSNGNRIHFCQRDGN